MIRIVEARNTTEVAALLKPSVIRDRATETTKMQHRLTAHVAIVALAAAEASDA